VREAAADLTLGDQRIEQPPGVMDADVVEHVHRACFPFDFHDRDVDEESVCSGRCHAVLLVRRLEYRRRVERCLVQARLDPVRKTCRMPVRNAGEAAERDAALSVPRLPVAQVNLLGGAIELGRGDRLQLRLHLLGRA
jgi:hypothetical protein